MYIPHLDLFDIGHNVSASVRLIGSCDPIEKDSNRLMLQPQKFLEMCPVSALVKIFSFSHYIPIDNHWIDHSHQLWSPNPHTRRAAAHQRQVICFRFMRKLNHKTSQKVSFGSYKGPLQIPIDIEPMSLTLHAINRWFVFQPKNSQLLEWP